MLAGDSRLKQPVRHLREAVAAGEELAALQHTEA